MKRLNLYKEPGDARLSMPFLKGKCIDDGGIRQIDAE